MNEPLVSVIMIFLDAERFIEEAVESVFAQTYPHWELLLVDDGSRDGSTAIAKTLAQGHPSRVRYLEHTGHVNRGMSASRNLGLNASRGAYVAFLDADAVYLPERLARHVDLLERDRGADMVQSRYEIWYGWQQEGTPLDVDHVGPSIDLYGHVIAPPVCLALMLAVPAISPGVCNVTLRREAALAAGGFEERFTGLFEDQVFFAKVYLSSAVVVIPDVLARYRRHAEACTRRYRGADAAAARLAFLNWLEAHVEQAGRDAAHLLEPLKSQLASERRTAARPGSGLRGRLLALVNDVLAAVLPARAYLALVRLRRERDGRSSAERTAQVLKQIPPVLVREVR
jgi:glycosyltransferase involved in cell wall biosynthesis